MTPFSYLSRALHVPRGTSQQPYGHSGQNSLGEPSSLKRELFCCCWEYFPSSNNKAKAFCRQYYSSPRRHLLCYISIISGKQQGEPSSQPAGTHQVAQPCSTHHNDPQCFFHSSPLPYLLSIWGDNFSSQKLSSTSSFHIFIAFNTFATLAAVWVQLVKTHAQPSHFLSFHPRLFLLLWGPTFSSFLF